jgi:hypothetical protein
MISKRSRSRHLWAASLGLASIAACAGAAPPGSAQAAQGTQGWTPDPDADPSRSTRASLDGGAARDPMVTPVAQPLSSDAGTDGRPRCPYGALEDPHRGFVRCLLPDERDAGWLPPPPQGDPPAEPPAAEPPADAGPAAPPPTVEIGAPKFENGEVTKVEKSLGKAAAELGRCVADHGGLHGDQGTVKLTFLVRSRGRAEGVEVAAAKGLSAEAAGCVRHLLKNKAIGAPSSDPVGVTVIITFKPGK